ncbi:Protein kinase [uncultured virus]|nr:Protein kinase [uncultured virus]
MRNSHAHRHTQILVTGSKIVRVYKNNMLRGDKLGEGTFGIVYSAISPNSKKEYAVKRNLVEDETSFIGVPREVDVLNKLRNHPHLVRLERVAFEHPFNTGCFSPLEGDQRTSQRDDAIHFIFSKAAYDLHRFIYGAIQTDFSLIKRYMVNILLGLEYMHSQRVIHRDLKPSNVLIFGEEKDALGVGNIAKICDFGLAKPYTYQGQQTPSTVTAWYRAPEIALGYPNYDYKSDVWSVGCILYEMVAKRAFIPDVPNDNDIIISTILGSLPQELSMRKFRELVRGNKWRTVKLTPAHSPRIRKTFMYQIQSGFTQDLNQQFEKQAGKLEIFCDLLDKMLMFDWGQRVTATDALNHSFFDDHRAVIVETRKQYVPQAKKDQPIIIRECIERKWMSQAATEIFNNRGSLKWYSHRALFQAMDLFDRYLSVMFHVITIPPNAVESELKGFIHDKFGAELRFMTCLYLCIKYFSSIHYPISYDTIVAEEYRTTEAKLIAEQFEGGFIKNCLEYDIYRPTVYEAADDFNDRLEDLEIRDLIILYSMNSSFSGMRPSKLYQYYRTNLRGRPIEMLFSPITKPVAPESTSINSHKPLIVLPNSSQACIQTQSVSSRDLRGSQVVVPTRNTSNYTFVDPSFTNSEKGFVQPNLVCETQQSRVHSGIKNFSTQLIFNSTKKPAKKSNTTPFPTAEPRNTFSTTKKLVLPHVHKAFIIPKTINQDDLLRPLMKK